MLISAFVFIEACATKVVNASVMPRINCARHPNAPSVKLTQRKPALQERPGSQTR